MRRLKKQIVNSRPPPFLHPFSHGPVDQEACNNTRMSSLRRLIALLLVTVYCACFGGSFAFGASPGAGKTPGISDADLVVHELCGKRIALLGESPSHGYGRTLQFKRSEER